MADLLNTSISGLLAFQRALDTTSHNITNANTVGYSRQTAELMTRQAHQSGSGWVGNGVDVTTIKRAYDDFLSGQSRSASSTYNHASTYSTQASRISNLFGDATTGLSASLQNFVNSVHSVADTPTSIPARQTLLSQAQSLIDRLKGYDASLRSLDAQTNAALETEADTVTSLARSIAQLNREISDGFARMGQPPNDLLDQRDRLIDELSTHINVNVVPQGDSSVSVFIGNGQPLVVGQEAAAVVAVPDPYDPTRNVIAVRTANSQVNITSSLSGGSMGGLLDFRSQMLDPARNALGRMSVAVAEVMNDQHRAGMDLNGDLGGDFFSVGGVNVRSNAGNQGSAAAAATRVPDAAGALTTGDYLMTYTASGWQLRRQDTGAVVTMTGTGAPGDPFVADGLSIEVSGTPQIGDRLLIQPTVNAVSEMRVLVADPNEIAAASPLVSSANAGNRGSAVVSPGEVTDLPNLQLQPPATITFIDATNYTISGVPGTHTMVDGRISHYGWTIEVTGTPAAGDSFAVSENTSGQGDNRNALKLANLLNEPVLGGGTTSLKSAVGQFVGEIGVKANQAKVTAEAQKVVADEAQGALQAVSGVNLDEEAANLIRYQQAYMAIAQMIRVADTIFQSVLQATSR